MADAGPSSESGEKVAASPAPPTGSEASPGAAGDAAAAAAAAGAPAAAAPQGDRENARATFYTAIDATTEIRSGKKDGKSAQQKFRALESTRAGPQITEYHKDIENLALTLDQRMGALLREHEKDFFLAYKTHMYNVQKEIRALKVKADLEEAKTKEDSKIKELERELDWFMTEALRLDELCKGYKKEVDKWKSKAEALDEDRRFLEDQIKGAKRQNKILRAAAERAKSSAYSAIMVARQKNEGAGHGGYPSSESLPPARGSAATGLREARARTPDLQGGATGSGGTLALADVSADGSVARTTVIHGLMGSDAEERYIEAIQTLKESIIREQHNIRMLQAARSSSYCQKSELEELFLKCVDEARRELVRKKHRQVKQEKSEKEQVMEALLHNEDVLVCLYEKLFPHRTGIARSLGTYGDADEVRRQAQLPLESLVDPRQPVATMS
mmetsp:Transcript_45132/g.107342  ORF Transcript_45132/g.107342 Transcript_45132/m.107342 type:complete len:445 (+) Transcript_45132:99-1433(+)|eukprot:CAMPEP_0178418198 /NCGR_PEP_ID=MMETSP0689_2-20121128/24964_1 /TAXON_ID=160604 /ORGANISM="Amphidinium massartii, Strain CS-259" /LENGTH=444 /DNA_ID=CAMNT_0020039583 /DNA_START=17 /DNA_END=1351 /DNA_ORIENTATION=-